MGHSSLSLVVKWLRVFVALSCQRSLDVRCTWMIWKVYEYDLLASVAEFFFCEFWICHDFFRQMPEVFSHAMPMPASRTFYIVAVSY